MFQRLGTEFTFHELKLIVTEKTQRYFDPNNIQMIMGDAKGSLRKNALPA